MVPYYVRKRSNLELGNGLATGNTHFIPLGTTDVNGGPLVALLVEVLWNDKSKASPSLENAEDLEWTSIPSYTDYEAEAVMEDTLVSEGVIEFHDPEEQDGDDVRGVNGHEV